MTASRGPGGGSTGRVRASWICASVCVALAIPTTMLLVLGDRSETPADSFGATGLGGLAFMLAFLVFAVVGALVVTGTAGNVVGVLFIVIAMAGGTGTFAYQYADYTIYVSPGALPGGAIFAWAQNIGLPASFGLIALAVLYFPDGRLPSPRWRPAAWIAWVGIAGVVLGYTAWPGPLDVPFQAVRSPFGIEGSAAESDLATGVGWIGMAAAAGLAGVAIVVRFRRSGGIARLQLKWIALVGACAGVVLVVNAASYALSVNGVDTLRFVVLGLTFASLPLAAGIAILRYRLYDIDLVINRTLVYTGLTAVLAGVYTGGVLLLQLVINPLTERSDLAVAGSTLVVAALFRPVRSRIQRAVDRRFYRNRYDAARTLEQFGGRVREQVDLGSLTTDLLDVARDTMQPTHASIWIATGRR